MAGEKQKNGKPKLPVFVYYLIILVVVFLIWSFLVPRAGRPVIKEITYNEFIDMLEKDEIDQVEISNTTITVVPKELDEKNPVYFETGLLVVDDYNLVEKLLQHEVDFGSPIEKSSALLNFLSFAVMLAGSWLVLFIIMRIMTKRMNSGVMSFGKSTSKIYAEKTTGKTFRDVAGQDEAKQALVEIIDFLNNPGKYTEIGAKLPKGALLVGPPGTGKTLLAKAVAGEAKVPFFSISGSEFVEMFVGLGASRVRDMFKQAVDNAPCIVFIDEIDAIGKSRDNVFGGNDEREQTLNQLLAEMDGFDSSKGVVILAATNRPEVLDKALLRPGRFDRRIIVDLPDLEGRKAILKVHARDVIMGPDVDFDTIALSTPGASGADLENIINEAALRAVRAKKKQVTQAELTEAVEVIIAGEEKKSTVLSEQEKRVVAYHEIGHALVSALLTHTEPVQKITIIPRTSGALGYTMQTPKEEKHLLSRSEALDNIKVLAGGRASEQIQFGEITNGASNDIMQATQLARAMVTMYGMSEKFGFISLEQRSSLYLSDGTSGDYSDQTASEIDGEIRRIISTCYEEAVSLLCEHKEILDALAAILYEKENITGKEFAALLAERGITVREAEENAVKAVPEQAGAQDAEAAQDAAEGPEAEATQEAAEASNAEEADPSENGDD